MTRGSTVFPDLSLKVSFFWWNMNTCQYMALLPVLITYSSLGSLVPGTLHHLHILWPNVRQHVLSVVSDCTKFYLPLTEVIKQCWAEKHNFLYRSNSSIFPSGCSTVPCIGVTSVVTSSQCLSRYTFIPKMLAQIL
jgi:hypothetical protein